MRRIDFALDAWTLINRCQRIRFSVDDDIPTSGGRPAGGRDSCSGADQQDQAAQKAQARSSQHRRSQIEGYNQRRPEQ